MQNKIFSTSPPKTGRNDPCWCGSQKKYKNCHLQMDQTLQQYAQDGHLIPTRSMIKSNAQIEGIRKAGVCNTALLDQVGSILRPGISTEEINSFIHKTTLAMGAIPAPLGFEGFPKSVCTSLNHEVCHGIPDQSVILQDGDIINIDVTTILNGYYADASRMFEIGTVSAERKQLISVAKECLDLGFSAAKPLMHLGDIGEVIETHAKKHGYSIVREIGGHGTGIAFHEEPWVSHIGKKGTGLLLVPGMVFTIEPMVNAGNPDVQTDPNNGWTVTTKDGSDSAQWEYTIVITETGAEILTH